MLEATPAEACETYAKALEENWDERLYLNFRRKVDELSSHLKHAAQGGREDEKLWAATSGAAADATGEMLPGTVDLDLQFLGPRGLRVLVERSRSVDLGKGAEGRAVLQEAIMRGRTANTGYIASAPPSQPLEHYFAVERRKKLGRAERRILCVDYARQELILLHKEEETKAFPFDALGCAEPGGKDPSECARKSARNLSPARAPVPAAELREWPAGRARTRCA